MEQQELEAVLGQYQTPAYVFDLDALASRAKRISECLGRAGIALCFAMKANPFLVGELAPFVERFEVCSPGEFRICEREGLPMGRLVVSGVHKGLGDTKRMVREYQGAGIFTIESIQQRDLLAACAKEAGVTVKALVRISSGNQFGVDYGLAKEIFQNRKEYPQLLLSGIQYYSGTQKKNLSVMEKELQKLDKFCREVQEELGIQIPELEYGPGFFVPYFQSDAEEHLEEVLEGFIAIAQHMEFSGKMTLELGRFLVAGCGSFLTSIVDRKENGGQVYGIVDGGIHHLNYFGQTMAMKLPFIQHIPMGAAKGSLADGAGSGKGSLEEGNGFVEGRPAGQEGSMQEGKASGEDGLMGQARSIQDGLEDGKSCMQEPPIEPEEKWNICGSLCTTADVIVKQFPLTGAKVGDVLVFERVGAYSVMEGISLFLSRDLPKVLFYTKGKGLRLVRDVQPTDGINSIV